MDAAHHTKLDVHATYRVALIPSLLCFKLKTGICCSVEQMRLLDIVEDFIPQEKRGLEISKKLMINCYFRLLTLMSKKRGPRPFR